MIRRTLPALSIVLILACGGMVSTPSPLLADPGLPAGSHTAESVESQMYFAVVKELSSQIVLEEIYQSGPSVTDLTLDGRQVQLRLEPHLWEGKIPSLRMQVTEDSGGELRVLQETSLALEEHMVYTDPGLGLFISLSAVDPL